ncbi:ANTAR domain-containing protein [Aquabacterium humicola]|uniref:ANTAR domain-containing protein n=1 Tax=Aquabacterium humicola TaxID=3237377 RepID=UPI002542D61D|nr:ANTAR domain-containing protein [Rubrivivax pictus]
MKRPRFQLAVTDTALRDELARLLQAAGYEVRTDIDGHQDSDFALLETSELAQRHATWQQAIQTSRSIATAVGMLMERHGLSPEHAFDALRRQARTERTQMVQLARDIVAGSARLLTPGPPPAA